MGLAGSNRPGLKLQVTTRQVEKSETCDDDLSKKGEVSKVITKMTAVRLNITRRGATKTVFRFWWVRLGATAVAGSRQEKESDPNIPLHVRQGARRYEIDAPSVSHARNVQNHTSPAIRILQIVHGALTRGQIHPCAKTCGKRRLRSVPALCRGCWWSPDVRPSRRRTVLFVTEKNLQHSAPSA